MRANMGQEPIRAACKKVEPIVKSVPNADQVKPEVGASSTGTLREQALAAVRHGDVKRARKLVSLAREAMPLDEKLFQKELDLLARVGRLGRIAKLIEFGKSQPQLRQAAFIWDFERYAMMGLYGRADRMISEARQRGETDIVDALRSRQYIFWLNRKARKPSTILRMIKSRSPRVRMWWWQRPFPGNWGDILNPYVVEKLTGIPPMFKTSGARLLAIGSMVGMSDDRTTVWGSGSARENQSINPKAKFCAVRGPITRSLVLKAGGNCPDVYGDPALLLPYIYKPKSGTGLPKARLGLILHHNHLPRHLIVDSSVRIIDIHRIGYDDIERFIDEVCSCEHILSSSLHGLIVSHAYGIATRWIDIADGESEGVPGDGMKFRDYFQSVGIQDVIEARVFKKGNKILPKMAEYCTELPKAERIVELGRGLLASAPFVLLPKFRKLLND